MPGVYKIDPYPIRADKIYSPDVFVSIWDTTKTSTGSSNDNQIKLPLVSTGTYNFYVDWGDGTSSTITAYNQAEVTHTYNALGVYRLMITGTLTKWSFNNSGDKLKLLRILNWGKSFQINGVTVAFYGCNNLVITALDAINLTSVTSMAGWFTSCTSLASIPNLGNWNVSTVTSFSNLFQYDNKFNQDISKWNTANVTNFVYAFMNATSFNQNLGAWNISHLTNATHMFAGVTLSTANYDGLLNGWAAQAPNIQNGVPFNGGNSKYSDAAVDARNTLVTTYGWTITDGGHV